VVIHAAAICRLSHVVHTAATAVEVLAALMAVRAVRVNAGVSVLAPTRGTNSRHSQFIFRSAQLSRNCTEESIPLRMIRYNR
jgi:hypothetical protein